MSTGSHIRKGERRREGERLKRAPALLSVHGKNNLDEKTVSSGTGPPRIQSVTAGKAHSESMRLARSRGVISHTHERSRDGGCGPDYKTSKSTASDIPLPALLCLLKVP